MSKTQEKSLTILSLSIKLKCLMLLPYSLTLSWTPSLMLQRLRQPNLLSTRMPHQWTLKLIALKAFTIPASGIMLWASPTMVLEIIYTQSHLNKSNNSTPETMLPEILLFQELEMSMLASLMKLSMSTLEMLKLKLRVLLKTLNNPSLPLPWCSNGMMNYPTPQLQLLLLPQASMILITSPWTISRDLLETSEWTNIQEPTWTQLNFNITPSILTLVITQISSCKNLSILLTLMLASMAISFSETKYGIGKCFSFPKTKCQNMLIMYIFYNLDSSCWSFQSKK